jgi:hypothetical protein
MGIALVDVKPANMRILSQGLTGLVSTRQGNTKNY